MNDANIKDILKYLPHRYPFLLLDRVVDFAENKFLKAVKNVSINEPFFQGHFPGRPVMPAVLTLEAMAQATGLLALRSYGMEATEDSIYYFVGIDKARFRRPVEPGDQLVIEVHLLRAARGLLKATGRAEVDGELVASAELLGVLRGPEG